MILDRPALRSLYPLRSYRPCLIAVIRPLQASPPSCDRRSQFRIPPWALYATSLIKRGEGDEKRRSRKIQGILESKTRKWWFLLVFILIGTLTPPIVTKGYDPSKTGEIILYILENALIKYCSPLYPVFKIIPIILIFALILFGNRIGRIFSLYAGINYLLFAFLQGIAITDEYGFGVVTGNFILMILVAIFWFWEAFVNKNDFTPQKLPIIRYWVVPLAFLAFWYPINLESMEPDFNLAYLFTNPAGLAFCAMTPVYLGILTLYHPKVNIVTLRVTSLLGVLIGFWNMVGNFLTEPNILWWNGVLHLPLVFISIYALVLSFRRTRSVEAIKEVKVMNGKTLYAIPVIRKVTARIHRNTQSIWRLFAAFGMRCPPTKN